MLRMLIATSAVLLSLLFGCDTKIGLPEADQEVIIVRIPPTVDPRLSAGENHCRFSIWRYEEKNGKDVAAACKDAGMPNDGVPLVVRLDVKGDVFLNNEPNGNLPNLKPLITRLADIFEQRRINHVFEPEGTRIEKGVGVRVPNSARYKDAISVFQAVKESNAQPIIVYLDGHLPYQILEP